VTTIEVVTGEKILIDLLSKKGPYQRSLRGKQELLAKAIGLKSLPLLVFDLCFGLGVDSWTMARLGVKVVAFERNEKLFQLMNSLLERAKHDSRVQEIAQRIRLVQGEALDLLEEQVKFNGAPQAIYLDPMFPESKKTALPKKELQVLRKLLGTQSANIASEELHLLKRSRSWATHRVAVKRSKQAQPIMTGFVHQVLGKSHRFDIYPGLHKASGSC
jgi:16S rRNA (guanine1516-N2)-methyltransferase